MDSQKFISFILALLCFHLSSSAPIFNGLLRNTTVSNNHEDDIQNETFLMTANNTVNASERDELDPLTNHNSSSVLHGRRVIRPKKHNGDYTADYIMFGIFGFIILISCVCGCLSACVDESEDKKAIVEKEKEEKEKKNKDDKKSKEGVNKKDEEIKDENQNSEKNKNINSTTIGNTAL